MTSNNSSLDIWIDRLENEPTVIAHQLDMVSRKLLALKLSEKQVTEAAFLDQRIVSNQIDGAWLPLDVVCSRIRTDRRKIPAFIVHCGHAGSTLITRLLGEIPDSWILREPLPLQTLAAEERLLGTPLARLGPKGLSEVVDSILAVYAKTPHARVPTIIKATSIAANLAARLLTSYSDTRVLCLWIPLEEYLVTMLRRENLRDSVRIAAGEWIKDIAKETTSPVPALHSLEDSQLCALNWVSSQMAFKKALRQSDTSCLPMVFNTFLDDPLGELQRVAEFFSLPSDALLLKSIVDGPWLARYSKDPRYPFNAVTRQKELDESRRILRKEVQLGRTFAEKLISLLPEGSVLSPY